jgi:branched-chain amino acid transport system substrate-binding protein
MMKAFWIAGILTGFFLAAAPAHADIMIGFAGPLSGPTASFGEQMKRGVEQAVADINAQGGIKGEKLVLHEVDDACDPKQAVTVANQLVSAGVKFVVGHFCSASSIAASKVYSEEGVFMISPASTNPALTDAGLPNIFRVCGRDDQQGAVLGQYILTHYKGKKVAVIHDNSTAGRGQSEQVKKTLNEGGVKEVLFEPFTPGEHDYSALVSKLKQLGVQVLMMGGYPIEEGLITRQLKEQDATVQILGADGLTTDQFWSIAGPAADGVLFTFNPDPRKRPEAKAAVEALRKSGQEPEGYTLYTYAAAQLIAEGIKRAGKADPAKVSAALRQAPTNTVLGPLGFDAKGDVTGASYVLYRWHDGKYAEIGE